jgi:hypothetical protein
MWGGTLLHSPAGFSCVDFVCAVKPVAGFELLTQVVLKSCGMWGFVLAGAFPDVSNAPRAFIFRI